MCYLRLAEQPVLRHGDEVQRRRRRLQLFGALPEVWRAWRSLLHGQHLRERRLLRQLNLLRQWNVLWVFLRHLHEWPMLVREDRPEMLLRINVH